LAAKSYASRGRERAEEPSLVRTDFQRDRDRIIHSKAFRRLKHKTQVFIAPKGDHYVTRLTHTLEVAQIARTISRALNLNEDLTEAIALGHDLGHPPFGHTGEAALDEAMPDGFRHAQQSLRVVEKLEGSGKGLNLTWEVRDGIVNSSKVREDIFAEGFGMPSTLEGQVVRVSDAIAYINHDVADTIRAGLITEADLPRQVIDLLGNSHSQRIDTLVCDIVEHSWAVTVWDQGEAVPNISMSPVVLSAANALREFLFERVYLYESGQPEAIRGRKVVRFLYDHYLEHPDEIQSDFVLSGDPAWRRVADYVAGMTDQFALSAAEERGFS
jgi:dGTPase